MSDWPEIEVKSAQELRDWLAERTPRDGSHWLIHGKKSAGETYLPYGEMVDALLCFGWIDSRPRKIDAARTAHLISPRKPGSVWSKDNRERVERLSEAGLITSVGQSVIDRAKRDGSWEALKETEEGIAPNYLSEALREAGSLKGWESLSLSVRRRSLEFLLSAKTEATRQKRVAKIVAASAVGKDPTVWKPKS